MCVCVRAHAHLYVPAFSDKYTLVLQLVGRLLVAEQCPVTVRIFLASDFPTEPPNIYMMPDDGISTRRINITDNNGKVIQSYFTNWRHVSGSELSLFIVYL